MLALVHLTGSMNPCCRQSAHSRPTQARHTTGPQPPENILTASNDNNPYLTPEEVSARYHGRIAVRTLANWRCTGVGPKFTKVGGRILYRLAEVVAWEQARTVESTSNYGRTR